MTPAVAFRAWLTGRPAPVPHIVYGESWLVGPDGVEEPMDDDRDGVWYLKEEPDFIVASRMAFKGAERFKL